MPVVELLSSHHDRDLFDCGKESLNEFLRRHARQNADRNIGVTHVVVEKAGDAKILGYYTLVARQLERTLMSRGAGKKKLPAGPVGVILLGRLAVDQSAQGRGLGRRMLLRAIGQTETAAREIGIHALVLDALDDDALAWYQSLDWGFETLLDDPRHLILPVATIRAAGLAALEKTDD
jgi:GNAT superfamily N-acetyltransferase